MNYIQQVIVSDKNKLNSNPILQTENNINLEIQEEPDEPHESLQRFNTDPNTTRNSKAKKK